MRMVSDADRRTGNGGRLSRRVFAGLVLGALVLCAVLLSIPAVSVCATEPISEAAGQDAKPRVVHVDASGAARLIAEGKVVVLDIRTPDEFAAGHFGGATNIDFHARDFADRLARLDRNQTSVPIAPRVGAAGSRHTRTWPKKCTPLPAERWWWRCWQLSD